MKKPPARMLTVFMLSMINIAAICNIANLPFTSQQGFAAIFYYALATLIFFLPVALISAELATGWPQLGGVYVWVREALGEKAGFVAIWLQWVENVIWYPTALSFAAATFAYAFNPALAQNKFYIMTAVLVIFWVITLINLLGMEISAWISSLCVIVGTFIPAALIIFLGIMWLALGNPSQITFSLNTFFPDISSFQNMSVIAAVLLAFGGLEMSAVHASEVQNPQKNYPRAILLSTIIILVIFCFGSLAISVVIPSSQIELASGAIEAIRTFLQNFNVAWAIPIVALLMTFGSLGTISTWTVGPSKGVMATARHGELPPFLQKKNKRNMPISILLIQASIVTLLSLVFILMPSVSSSYRTLFFLSAQLYLIMYGLMFIAGIVLRYKKPKVKRSFKVPGGNFGMWVVGSIGTIGAIFAIIEGLMPPKTLHGKDIIFFECFLIGGIIIFTIIPVIIHSIRKPSWHLYKSE
jgi:glutamate:GABA antiporter